MKSMEERYQIARSLNFGEREKALRHGPVRPHWAADGRHFWYTTRDDAGLQHVLVDVAARSRRALFDAPALEAALAKALGAEVKAEALADLCYDDATGSVSFTAQGGCWRWHDGASQLQREADAFAAHEAVSPDGSAAVSLAGANLQLRRRGEAGTVALTTDGEPDRGYGDFTDFISQVALRLQGQPRKPRVLWAPDSQQLVVQRVDLRRVPLTHLVQSVPAQGVRPVLHSYRFPTPMDDERGDTELWFIGRDGSRVRAQLDGLECGAISHLDMGLCRWSDDGRHLYVVVGDRAATRLVLWRIDSRDGSAQRLLEETGPAVVLPAPSIGEAPVFHVLRDGRVIWWSQRSGWGHLHLIGPEGQAQALTQGPWQVRGLLHVDEDAGHLLFTASGREPGVDAYYVAAYRMNMDGSGLTLLTPEPAQHDFILAEPEVDGARSVAPDGNCFVDNYSTVFTPPRAVLRDANGALLMELEAAPPGDTWPAGMPLPEPFAVTALDAEALDGAGELWGVLYKPAGFDPTQRYPVVEVVYGAPQTAVVPKTWMSPRYGVVAEQLAAVGFVVVVIDGPGTPYRSRAFQLASHGRVETCGGLPDHVNAIRRLGATRPWMDLERVGIIGGSGGGYATVRALGTFPDFYRVGVAMCGNHDQSSYVAMWGERYQGLYDEALYAAQANTTVARNIAGELFLIHGEMDDNVHPAMTMRVVDALIKADRNFDLLLVPNAGHMLILLPYVQRRTWDYLVEKLMGSRAPRP